jgi:cytochrome c-type biogenesis protein CcmH/NrfG
VARGTQHRKRRPAQNARAAAVAAAPKKQKPPQWQEELFFQRLRVHAKGVFVLLALVFAVSFVFLGVGSGANGITDALQNAFNFGRSSGGASISSLEKKTQQHPLDAKAWRDLATAYEAKHRTNDAISALSQYTGLRSKDQSALAELASEYGVQAQDYATQYQAAQLDVATQTPPAALFAPPASSPFGKAFSDPKALQDPISTTLQQLAQAKQNAAFSGYTSAQRSAERAYQRLAALTPTDANAQLQLAQAAQAAQDTKVAVAAYEKFLKLAPTDPLAAQVRKQIKTLTPTTAATTTKTPSK